MFTLFGQDMQHKIKEHFRGMPDEFMTNEHALNAKVGDMPHLSLIYFTYISLLRLVVYICIKIALLCV